MKLLWIVFIVLASLGSIYPFDFQASPLDTATIGAFLKTCCGTPGRGDVLANIILFSPIGFAGMLALRPEYTASRRFILTCLIGMIIALALQVMQIFLPSRDENLQDVAWNFLGLAGGASLARIIGSFAAPPASRKADISLVPMTLIGTWLIYRLIPFIPSLDLQLIKDSLKPALSLEIAPIYVVHNFTAWVVVAYLLRFAQRGVHLDNWLPTLITTVFLLEILIVDNSISLSGIVGALLAILFWQSLARYLRRREGVLVMLLLVTLALTGLAPFDIRWQPVAFNWLPFHGFLDGSMYLNTQSAAEKVFLYGSLVYLMWQMNINRLASVIFGVLYVTSIEYSQTFLVGHTPEITDPLLVVLAAMALLAMNNQENRTTPDLETKTPSPSGSRVAISEGDRDREKHHEKWVRQAANLRVDQFNFLKRLAEEMEMSVSRVIRQIIARFIEELDEDEEAETTVAPGKKLATVTVHESRLINYDTGRTRWVNHTVNLRGHQFDFLKRLSREMEISVSGAMRRIVADFIDGLGEGDTPDSSKLQPSSI